MRIMIRAQAVGRDFNSARTQRGHAEWWEKAIMEKYGGDVTPQTGNANQSSIGLYGPVLLGGIVTRGNESRS